MCFIQQAVCTIEVVTERARRCPWTAGTRAVHRHCLDSGSELRGRRQICSIASMNNSLLQLTWLDYVTITTQSPQHTHDHFTALFPGPTVWAGARRELLDFMVQGKINRGRHTDHPAGRHSIQTNQCPPPPHTPLFLWAGCPSCRPTDSVKALKATSAFELGRRR